MRPINITNQLKEKAKEFSSNLFKENIKLTKPIEGLKNLNSSYPYHKHPHEAIFLRYLIKNYESILNLIPNEQEILKNNIDNRFPKLFIKKVLVKGKSLEKATDFSKAICKALRYDALRKYEAHKILKITNIKACPYCNAILTVNVIKNDRKNKVNCHLDHFFPKTQAPYLSTSFFNLIPSCSNCNQTKSNSIVKLGIDFHLYAEETPRNPFKFELDKAETIKKIIGVKKSNIEVLFTYRDSKDKYFVERHNKAYSIQGIYNTQIDIVEEMIWRMQAYGKPKINELSTLLKISKNQVKRMVTGNYMTYKDIHKRPLSKYMQDIAEDLKLFK